MRSGDHDVAADVRRGCRESESALHTLAAGAAHRVLVEVKPSSATIGCPFRVDVGGAPQCHAIETDEKVFVVPDRCERLLHIRRRSDEPLCCTLADPLTRDDATVHVDGPLVVTPRVDVVAVDARAELFEVVPREVEGLVDLAWRKSIRDDDVPLGVEIVETLLRPRRKARDMNILRHQLVLGHR